jgi:hypothetical protein
MLHALCLTGPPPTRRSLLFHSVVVQQLTHMQSRLTIKALFLEKGSGAYLGMT